MKNKKRKIANKNTTVNKKNKKKKKKEGMIRILRR